LLAWNRTWSGFAASPIKRRSWLVSDGLHGWFRPYLPKVIYRYQDCGDLRYGFGRVKCKDCNYDYLPACLLLQAPDIGRVRNCI
jgi:hypothetical protein